MLVNYHYYTVKTLAYYAGFSDETAQFIAYFSQYVDDYIMRKPFIVDREPPEFFLKNSLADRLCDNRWTFAPCPTGFSLLNSRSHNYQIHTLMPFHFILPVPFPELPEDADRSNYRCIMASKKDDLLINHLMKETAEKVNLKDKYSLMALGMMLHIYADTYSHDGFSGFHGWENEFYIAGLETKHPWQMISQPSFRLRNTFLGKHFAKPATNCNMNLAERIFFRTLPSIGHCNADSVTDFCERKILLYTKMRKDGDMESVIERNNSEAFADCSRRILKILCKITGKPAPNSDEWHILKRKLAIAQNINNQKDHVENKERWSRIFPNISYCYQKNKFIEIKLQRLNYKNRRVLNKLDIDSRELSDIYSEHGDQARAVFPMISRDISDLFFMYNELAYKHVYNVTGEYSSIGSMEQMSSYQEIALGTTPSRRQKPEAGSRR
ncbi:MAG: hypothetical protein LBB91_03280 [Clostridiales bacterium]|jgi:hypothetical protein|nr:hypothetical protein [Clostridiales bacterium]